MFHALILFLLGLVLLPQLASSGTWSCSVQSNITMVPNIALAQPQYGSASFIKADLAEPWPVLQSRGRQLRVVRYCFETEEARNLLNCKIQDALSLWSRGLGYPGNGHSLAWLEVNGGKTADPPFKYHLCYHDMGYLGLGLRWNDKVKDDTLVVRHVGDTSESLATVGYKGINKGEHPHSLALGTHASIPVVAHELGHGDDHVVYKCDKVRGYYHALIKAMNAGHPRDEAVRRLCEDEPFAQRFDFRGTSFTKNDLLSTTPDRWGDYDEPGGFDVHSIMQYSSYTFATPACFEDVNDCPLAEILRDQNGNVAGSGYIHMPLRPSDGDIEWVKRNYPPLPDIVEVEG